MLWFLKGPAWCLWGKTETGMAQLGAVDTEWVLLHSTTPVSLDWHGCVCVWAACLQAGQWGNRLLSTLGREIWKCLERRRGEEGGKQSRTEGLSGLSRGEWGAWRRVERDWGTEKKDTFNLTTGLYCNWPLYLLLIYVFNIRIVLYSYM